MKNQTKKIVANQEDTIMMEFKLKGGFNGLVLKSESKGTRETWCEAYTDGKRNEKRDGFYSNSDLLQT
jgi:hypothetical protein